jgi:hypothetical protein
MNTSTHLKFLKDHDETCLIIAYYTDSVEVVPETNIVVATIKDWWRITSTEKGMICLIFKVK